jgi:hypothetical protein
MKCVKENVDLSRFRSCIVFYISHSVATCIDSSTMSSGGMKVTAGPGSHGVASKSAHCSNKNNSLVLLVLLFPDHYIIK